MKGSGKMKATRDEVATSTNSGPLLYW